MGFALEILRTRPAVHEICAGAFVQESLHLGASMWVFPMEPLGFAAEAQITARYAHEVVGADVDDEAFKFLVREGRSARPLIAIVHHSVVDASPEDLETRAGPDLDRARLLVAWSAGEVPEPIARVTVTSAGCFFRLHLPFSRERQRLGLGNEREPHEAALRRLYAAMESDDRFAFAVSLFREALREQNAEFRAARFFACLEALTYRIRGAYAGSRSAVRALLGLDAGAVMTIGIDGQQVSFDRVELAGRLRAKLFHGVPFDEGELNEQTRAAYNYLREHPRQLGDLLHMDCELEIARWANGASRGQVGANGAS